MNPSPSKSAVIASSRPWGAGILAQLQNRTGYEFSLITEASDLTPERLAATKPSFVFFPHWSHRIPPEVYERFECVIFHMTDLPFGRGGSPLQNLIARRIYETQISAIRCVAELDAGPVYLKKPLSLHGSAEEIFLRAADVVTDMIVELIERLPQPEPQRGEPTYFKRRTPEEGDLAKAGDLQGAFDLIRMLDATGYPRAFVSVGPFRIEFSRATRGSDELVADARIRIADLKRSKQ